MSKTVILPVSDDGNRGDQALVWQTKDIACRAGLADECFMLTEKRDGATQSREEGIGILTPILRHPSTRSTRISNMRYGSILLLVWGIISLVDGVRSLLFLSRFGRQVLRWSLSDEERRTIHEIGTADACFVKGGGFIHTTDSITDPYRAYFFLYHIMLAQSLGTPVYVMPNSFGPLKGRIFCGIVRHALSRCRLVTARETISQQALENIGVSSELFPDLAFGLESDHYAPICLATIRDRNPDRPLVGITARPYRFPGSEDPDEAYKKYIQEMAGFADWLGANGYFPVFIEHVLSDGDHESDISAIEQIETLLTTKDYAILRYPELTSRQIKSVYRECDYVVGTRFHSVIFALAEGTPAIAIGYGGNKSAGIMKDLGLTDYVIPIEGFAKCKAEQLFSRLVRDDCFPGKIDLLMDEVQDSYKQLILQIRQLHSERSSTL